MIQLFSAHSVSLKSIVLMGPGYAGVHAVGITSYNAALNPTKKVSPTCSVGARRLPLRPITALRMTSCESTLGAKTSTFLPLAT
jgi:hypothetical protein